VLRCATVRGCTCGELVKVTGFSDVSLPGFFGFWWKKTQELEGVVGSNLQSWSENGSRKESANREVVQTSGGTGVKSYWVVETQCKSSSLTRMG
jgi:hypothetical protein